MKTTFAIVIKHKDSTRLFGNNCGDCGMMTIYADDGIYARASNSRNL